MITKDVEKFMSGILPGLMEQAAIQVMQDGLKDYLYRKGYTREIVADTVEKATIMFKEIQTRKKEGQPVINRGASEIKPNVLELYDNEKQKDFDKLAALDMLTNPDSKYRIDIAEGDSYTVGSVHHEGSIIDEILQNQPKQGTVRDFQNQYETTPQKELKDNPKTRITCKYCGDFPTNEEGLCAFHGGKSKSENEIKTDEKAK